MKLFNKYVYEPKQYVIQFYMFILGVLFLFSLEKLVYKHLLCCYILSCWEYKEILLIR